VVRLIGISEFRCARDAAGYTRSVKAVILAGGRGSRLAEETDSRPKPLVEIGGRPIIWHIMNIYAHHGIDDFLVCTGYRGYQFKEYFANLALHNSDVTFDFESGSLEYHGSSQVRWKVTVADTGESTMTAGRIRRIVPYLDPGETFCLTYGDGVADVDITAAIAFHREQGRLITMTAVLPPARFGILELDGPRVAAMFEKNPQRVTPVNGGYFVIEPEALELITSEADRWETEVLVPLAERGQVSAYEHRGFWQPMDTLWEKDILEELWSTGDAPWKVW
jgi:glucose-1-phosphate cytidylyltransferase